MSSIRPRGYGVDAARSGRSPVRPIVEDAPSRSARHRLSAAMVAAAWRSHRPSAILRALWDEIAMDFELLALFGVLLALCAWFALSDRIPPTGEPDETVATASLPVPPPGEPFAFVAPRAYNWLLPAMLAATPRPAWNFARPAPDREHAPGPTPLAMRIPTIEQHALVAEPPFDPLGAVILSGLPETAHLSAGAALSATDWAVAFGDLNDLVIRLPARRKIPFRTTVDLRTRAGVKIHSFTVELRDDRASSVAATRPRSGQGKAAKVPRKGTPKPAAGSGAGAVLPTKAVLPASRPLPPPKPGAQGTAPPAAPAGFSALLPLGFFKPDPKDSAASGLTPDLRDDPRFTTLRGLGMRPDGVGAPAPPPQPSSSPEQ